MDDGNATKDLGETAERMALELRLAQLTLLSAGLVNLTGRLLLTIHKLSEGEDRASIGTELQTARDAWLRISDNLEKLSEQMPDRTKLEEIARGVEELSKR